MAKLRTGESKYGNRYRYRYIDDQGNRKAIYGKTLKELREKEDLFFATDDVKPKSVSLYSLVEMYLETRGGLKSSTKETYSEWLKSIKDYDLLQTDIQKIKTSQIKSWISQMSKEGKSQSTINGYFTALIKPAFDFAVEDEMLNRNPASFKLTLVVNKNSKQTRVLTEQELVSLDLFLKGDSPAAKRNRDLIRFILETGMRASEVAGLTIDRIDFIKKEITVDRQLVYKNGRRWIDDVKTRSGGRVIPMSIKAEECIKNQIQREINPEPELDGVRGFIFLNAHGKVLDRNNIYRKYEEVAKLAHIEGTSPHSLRHTYCTNLIRKGVPIKTVQYLMGHSDAKVTLNIYAHVTNENARDDLRRFLSTDYEQTAS